MKKLILIIIVFLTFSPVFSQDNAGDSCSSPIPIGPGTHYVENINGENYELNCSEYDASNGDLEWYIYTPNDDYLTTITSDLEANDGLDTRFHVYQGSCDDLSCVSGDDDSGDGYLSVRSFYAYTGESYYIAWDDRWENEAFEFELTESDPPPPPPFDFTIASVSTSGSERGLVDMNNDKLDDLVSIQNTSINIHYQLEEGGFNPVSIETTYADNSPSWSMAAGDFDRNGYNDLLYGGGNGVTFMQANADGTAYTEISGEEYVFSQRSNFVDINNDGHLDAFVCHDVQPTVYYINDGNGVLEFFQGPNDEGISSGIGGVAYDLAPYPGVQEGGNYGSVWIDYDNDRDIDMFIAKCRGGSVQWKNNELWRNNGDGTFSNVADVSGYYQGFYPDGGHSNESNLGDPVQTWSSAWGDFNNDGFMDVYVGASATGDGAHKLMKNNGDGTFTDVTSGSGAEEAPWGIENNSADVDNDGYIDILTNGGVLLNNGDLTFSLYTANTPGPGAIGDANNDGFIDVFNGTNLYLQEGNNGNNWLKIATHGVTSNINGIGARIEINSPGIGTQIRDVMSGTGFRFMSSLNTHFGLGSDSSVNSITVYWPSGIVDVVNNPETNTTIHVAEGETLSLESSFIEDLIIYPNPVKSILTIDSSLNLDQSIISVFDLAGRRVMNYRLASGINSVNVSELSAGEYILRVITKENHISSQKFIKH
ncbi:MAG: T9SS type A sorting domain-containing protein [Flavobacteriales bacterium]|nr:MAG: T9SS type A sorting domain-containing protein [Flavobacteriales bacterium]